MEHLSPGSSPGTNAGSLSDFEETAKINRWPVKSHVGPIKSIVTNTHARTTIDRIPPELLSKIFLVCAALWPTQDLDSSLDDYFVHSVGPGDFTCGDRLPWIAIAQVCPYWRSVALACGELWRGLLFSSPEATKEMLRRSKGVTLIVKAEGGYNPSIYENVRTVIPDIGRVSVLHLCFKAYHLQALLRDISVAFPVLESLRLRAKVISTAMTLCSLCQMSYSLGTVPHCVFLNLPTAKFPGNHYLLFFVRCLCSIASSLTEHYLQTQILLRQSNFPHSFAF